MKCPYCSEDIKDEATVCHYCKRDLSFFKPFEERIKILENKLSQVAESVIEISKSLDSSQVIDHLKVAEISKERAKTKHIRLVLAVLLPVLCSTGLFWLRNYLYLHLDWGGDPEGGVGSHRFLIVANTILFTVPIVFGFWLGLKWQGFHFKSYIILGSIIGVLETIIALSVFGVRDTLMMHSLVVTRAALGFTSGALFGDWVERKVFPDKVQTGFAEKIAKKLIDQRGKSQELGYAQGITHEDRIKRLASIIAALAPFLALIGSIVSAYFTYLGALAKKP